MSTFRAFNGCDRISTAVVTKSGAVYQVFPEKADFESIDAWKAAWGGADSFTESAKATAAAAKPRLPSPIANRRRTYEFAEFLDPVYKWLVTSAAREDEYTLSLTLNDGSTAKVRRCNDYLKAPRIWRNDVEYLTQYEYSPAITSVRWLMMLMFCKEPTDTKDV